MADFIGKFQYLDSGGSATQEGACRAQFDAQTFTLTPESGAAMAFDLGDLDSVASADWEIRLPLYTGNTILLRQIGRAYETVAHDLLDAYRNRVLQCLLLEDMEEVARFNGTFALGSQSGPAEIRLFKTNLAVLPVSSQSFQWRLADVDSVRFDANSWEVTLQAGQDQLKFTKLAKRTEEFAAKLREEMSALASQTAQALHTIFPFLNPDQLQSAAGLLREGQSAPVSKLAAINTKIPAALTANAVDKDLKPYYDDLVARNGNGMLYAGFKLIRQEDEEVSEAAAPNTQGSGPSDAAGSEGSSITNLPTYQVTNSSASPDADASGPEVLYWFFFPIPGNVVAWEASSSSGRATYFFRLVEHAQAALLRDPLQAPGLIDAAVRRLNRVLGMLNFRRRPIYLSDDELEMDPKFHRYAISARRLPEVRQVRASFLGRAFHSSHEAWQGQVKTILEKAGT